MGLSQPPPFSEGYIQGILRIVRPSGLSQVPSLNTCGLHSIPVALKGGKIGMKTMVLANSMMFFIAFPFQSEVLVRIRYLTPAAVCCQAFYTTCQFSMGPRFKKEAPKET